MKVDLKSYRGWPLLDALPEGWAIDKTAGSPVCGYEFCTNGQGVLGRGIRQSELRAETPYNTYVIDGMPPTPIANPGIASLEAAMNPEETPYVFFVADGTGGHAFAETLAEHNENVARWREIEAERSGN